MNNIKEMAKIITDFTDRIISDNTEKSFINEAEFEFGCKDETFKTEEFHNILTEHFKDKNITYKMMPKRKGTAYFKIKFHDWTRKDEK